MLRSIVAIVGVLALATSAWGQSGLPAGFTAEEWLTGAGDLMGMAVGPGGAWGEDLYVYRRGGDVLRVTGRNTYEVFATGLGVDAGDIAFDPHGDFGGDMYVGAHKTGGPPDYVYRCSPAGSSSVFFNNSSYTGLTTGVAFGVGGFGNSLYMPDAGRDVLLRFNPAGGVTHSGSGLGISAVEDDLVFSSGGAFGNNAYVADLFGYRIRRMTPAGTVSTFASGHTGVALAMGEGVFGEKLYFGTNESDIYAYAADGSAELFASDVAPLGAGEELPVGSIHALAISADTMWITTKGGGPLLRVTVPEPATVGMLALGGLALVKRRRGRRHR